MNRYFTLVILSIFCVHLSAELNYKKFFKNRAATKEWKNENFIESEQLFRDNTINNPNVGDFHFNRGTALYKMEEYEEALSEFQRALNDKNFKEKDKIYHNMGNIAYQKNEYGDALELYKRALLENPNNIDARKNYEFVKMLPPPPQEQDQDQNQQQNEKEDNEQKQPPPPSEEDPDKKEAERMLQAIEQNQEQEKNEEKETGSPNLREKYW